MLETAMNFDNNFSFILNRFPKATSADFFPRPSNFEKQISRSLALKQIISDKSK
ncbi:MAG: hypothetical protein WBH31_06700 [Promethearchaeia archaeon]